MRWQHVVHWRQSPHPRATPQHQPERPADQQPDLRPDQGPVLADQSEGQGDQVVARRPGGPTLQSDQRGVGCRGDLRGPHA